MIIRSSLSLVFLSLVTLSCSPSLSQTSKPKIISDSLKEVKNQNEIISDRCNKPEILLGIDVLEESGFDILAGKKVGLITNQTGVNRNLKSTIDILHESNNVELIALFGPEHGVRGDVEGGKYIEFYKDNKTNLPVYSLYGRTRKPNDEMLKNIDVLVYDIQDVGVRSYTFISTMGLAVEAASENGIDFVVLDRPNPLGGNKVEGNIIEDDFKSFIGQYPIPYVYGLTCGELLSMLIGEKYINISSDIEISVIPMESWNRAMVWQDTNLKWIPTSPHIPQPISAFFYPMTGILGELRSVISIGVGYTLPFQIVGTEWINSTALIDTLNNMFIPGLTFTPITYQPYYAFGEEKTLNGIQIHIIDYNKVNLLNTQFYILFALKKTNPEMDLFKIASSSEIRMFNKGIGSEKIIELYNSDAEFSEVQKYLEKDLEVFKEKSKKYFLYN